jgi:hypothetical protein
MVVRDQRGSVDRKGACGLDGIGQLEPVCRAQPRNRLNRPRDPVQLGKLIGDILTGEVEDKDGSSDRKNVHAARAQHRYSQPECIGATKHAVNGRPDRKHVSTSYVERQNLNIRMGNRRMTRLTNAFSKKAENHAHMMAIYFMHYNFVRIHQTLKVTPAMAAGVTGKLWEMTDMVVVLEEWEARQEG